MLPLITKAKYAERYAIGTEAACSSVHSSGTGHTQSFLVETDVDIPFKISDRLKYLLF
jgi:hypothetical protein